MEPRRSGAMRPAWNASRRERDRGETHGVSRSGRGRPAVAGRSRRQTIPLYEPKGLLACFDQCHVAGYPRGVTDQQVAGVLEAPGDDELRGTAPRAIGALLVASGLLRIGAVGVGVAVQFRISDLAGGRPSGVDIGLVGAAQAVTEMVFAPILAHYADRLGRRIFLVL